MANGNIRNILKNGKEIKDLTGHVVKKAEIPTIYTLMERKKLSARYEAESGKEKKDGNN